MTHREPDTVLWRDEDLGLTFRAGSLDELQQGSFDAAADALRAGDFARAEALAGYTIEEAREPQEAYADWIVSIPEFLALQGVTPAAIAEERARLAALIRAPDGGPFDPEAGWLSLQRLIAASQAACARKDAETALLCLEQARLEWLRHHDRFCDWICELIAVIARRLGEPAVAEFWDGAMSRWYSNYDRFALDRQGWDKSARQLLHMAVLALRGHLTGPRRRGEIAIRDEGDCWALEFQPCGSGGRSFNADPAEGLPPRFEAPFRQALVQGRHDWAWNRPGVCLYCTHCCQLGQRLPIRRLGYPARVIDPPVWPQSRDNSLCTWRIYKHPSLVPAAAYMEVGETKPVWSPDGSMRQVAPAGRSGRS